MPKINVKLKDGTYKLVNTDTNSPEDVANWLNYYAEPGEQEVPMRGFTKEPEKFNFGRIDATKVKYMSENALGEENPFFSMAGVEERIKETKQELGDNIFAAKTALGAQMESGRILKNIIKYAPNIQGGGIGGAPSMGTAGITQPKNTSNDLANTMKERAMNSVSDVLIDPAQKRIQQLGGPSFSTSLGKEGVDIAAIAAISGGVGATERVIAPKMVPKPLFRAISEATKKGQSIGWKLLGESGKAGLREGVAGSIFETLTNDDPNKSTSDAALHGFAMWGLFGSLLHGGSSVVGLTKNPETVKFVKEISKFDNITPEQVDGIVSLVKATAKANKIPFEKAAEDSIGKNMWERIKFGYRTPTEEFVRKTKLADIKVEDDIQQALSRYEAQDITSGTLMSFRDTERKDKLMKQESAIEIEGKVDARSKDLEKAAETIQKDVDRTKKSLIKSQEKKDAYQSPKELDTLNRYIAENTTKVSNMEKELQEIQQFAKDPERVKQVSKQLNEQYKSAENNIKKSEAVVNATKKKIQVLDKNLQIVNSRIEEYLTSGRPVKNQVYQNLRQRVKDIRANRSELRSQLETQISDLNNSNAVRDRLKPNVDKINIMFPKQMEINQAIKILENNKTRAVKQLDKLKDKFVKSMSNDAEIQAKLRKAVDDDIARIQRGVDDVRATKAQNDPNKFRQELVDELPGRPEAYTPKLGPGNEFTSMTDIEGTAIHIAKSATIDEVIGAIGSHFLKVVPKGDLAKLAGIDPVVFGYNMDLNPEEFSTTFGEMFRRYIANTEAYPNEPIKPIFNKLRKYIQDYVDASGKNIRFGGDTSPEVASWFNKYFNPKMPTITNSTLSKNIGADTFIGRAWQAWMSEWDTLAKYAPELKEKFSALTGVRDAARRHMEKNIRPIIEKLSTIEPIKYTDNTGKEINITGQELLSQYLYLYRGSLPKKIGNKPAQEVINDLQLVTNALNATRPEDARLLHEIFNDIRMADKTLRDLWTDPQGLIKAEVEKLRSQGLEVTEQMVRDVNPQIKTPLKPEDVPEGFGFFPSYKAMDESKQRLFDLTGKIKDEVDDPIHNLMDNYMKHFTFIQKNAAKSDAISTIKEVSQRNNKQIIFERTEPVAKGQIKVEKPKQVEYNDIVKTDLDEQSKQLIDKLSAPNLAKDETAILEDGVWKAFKVTDRMLREVLDDSMIPSSALGRFLEKTFVKSAKLLRAGITGDPDFMVRNITRDFPVAGILDEPLHASFLANMISMVPETAKRAFVEYPQALAGVLRNSGLGKYLDNTRLSSIKSSIESKFTPKYGEKIAERQALYNRFNEAGVGGSQMVKKLKPKDVRLLLEDWYGINKGNIILQPKGMLQKVGDTIQWPFKKMASISDIGEQIPRFAAAEKAYVKSLKRLGYADPALAPEAAKNQAVRDAIDKYRTITVDFADLGSSTRMINKVIPFFGAGISGVKNTFTKMSQNPAGWFGKAFTSVTVPALTTWYINKDEEWYRNLSPMRKVLTIPITEHFSIPSPFDVGVIAAWLPVAIMDNIYQGMIEDGLPPEQAGKRIREEGLAALGVLVPMTNYPLPPVVSSAVGLVANKNMFFGGNIESNYEQKLPPYMRYNKNTPETYKGISRIAPNTEVLSPKNIDYVIRTMSGQVPTKVLQGTESGIKYIYNKSKGIKEVHPAKRGLQEKLAGKPLIGTFFKQSSPYGRDLIDFWENTKMIETKIAEVNKSESNLEFATTDEEENFEKLAIKNDWAVSLAKDMKSDSKYIGQLIGELKYVSDPKNTDYTEDQMRDEMDDIIEEMLTVAKEFNDMYYEVKKEVQEESRKELKQMEESN